MVDSSFQDRVLSWFEVKSERNEIYACLCPSHEDRTPSLHVRFEADKALIHCKAGCGVDEIMRSIGKNTRDLFNGNGKTQEESENWNLVRTYAYTDEDERVLYYKDRLECNGKKRFIYRRVVGGVCVYGLGDQPQVLYNLGKRKILKANPLAITIIVEGEKCVESLQMMMGDRSWVTTSGSADSWRPEFWSLIEDDHQIIVLPDQDAPGRLFAESILKTRPQ